MNQDSRTLIDFTKCTRSQTVLYYHLSGDFLAKAHRYIRPDGELAGRVQVDPKTLVLDDGTQISLRLVQ